MCRNQFQNCIGYLGNVCWHHMEQIFVGGRRVLEPPFLVFEEFFGTQDPQSSTRPAAADDRQGVYYDEYECMHGSAHHHYVDDPIQDEMRPQRIQNDRFELGLLPRYKIIQS